MPKGKLAFLLLCCVGAISIPRCEGSDLLVGHDVLLDLSLCVDDASLFINRKVRVLHITLIQCSLELDTDFRELFY